MCSTYVQQIAGTNSEKDSIIHWIKEFYWYLKCVVMQIGFHWCHQVERDPRTITGNRIPKRAHQHATIMQWNCTLSNHSSVRFQGGLFHAPADSSVNYRNKLLLWALLCIILQKSLQWNYWFKIIIYVTLDKSVDIFVTLDHHRNIVYY